MQDTGCKIQDVKNYKKSHIVHRASCIMHHASCIKKNKGFTLLELVFVLFLITVILSLSLVFFANFLPSNRFKATVRDISTTIRQARALAQIHGERQIITIDLDSRKYGIEGRITKNVPSGIQIEVVDPIAGEIREGQYQYMVHSIGIEGGTIVLWDGERKASITIDPVVGSLVIR